MEIERSLAVPAASAADDRNPGSLKEASIGRLACLFRHWTWADEAMARFDRELADGWTYDEDLTADHPFGAYYHWSALLCGLGEAALDRELLSPGQLETIQQDLDGSMAWLRTSRQLLVTIPHAFEAHPRVADLMRDTHTLGRLRRIHRTFGEALREEKAARELEPLLEP
jgi:hypothetical protein